MSKLNYVLFAIIILLLFTIVYERYSSKGALFMLATSNQLACIESVTFEDKYELMEVSLPQHFSDLILIKIDTNESVQQLNLNYNACFVSRSSELIERVYGIESVYQHFVNTGAKNIGFYKPQNSQTVYIFSEE